MEEYAIKEIYREHGGKEYRFPLGVLAKNVETDEDHRFLTEREIKELKDKPGRTDALSDNTVTFDPEPAGRALLQSGGRLGALFAQANAWLRGLKEVAFTADYGNLSNRPALKAVATTADYGDLLNRPKLGAAASKGVSESLGVTKDGYVADARALKAVNDKLGEMRFERSGNDIFAVYQVGADTVRKKLGSREAAELPLSLLTSGNGKREITAGPVDFTGYGFLKLVYDYTTSNREALHIDISSGGTVRLRKYLAKGYSKGQLTLQEGLESVIDVSGVQGACHIRLWADDDPDSGGGMDGLGNFVVKSMVLYGS